VDFEVAKQRLDAFSPVRHCCSLYVEGEGAASSGCDGGRHDDHDDDDDDVSNAGHTESQESSLVERIMLDIGGGGGGGGDNSTTSPPVTVGMLNRQGRAIVEPIVQEFIDEVGIEVSTACIIKLS